MSKILKSTQSCSNGHFPYHCLFYFLARALDGWRNLVPRVFVHFCACWLHETSDSQSRSQSFVPLDQRSENESSGSIHFRHARHRYHTCRLRTAHACAVKPDMQNSVISIVIWKWCSQSSRFPTAGQGERSSGNEIEIDCFCRNLPISNDPVVRISRNLAKENNSENQWMIYHKKSEFWQREFLIIYNMHWKRFAANYENRLGQHFIEKVLAKGIYC